MKIKHELQERLENLQADMRQMVNQRLFRSFVRWTLTILLYYYFWEVAWVRWSLWIVLPMILLNLVLTIAFYYTLSKKIRTTKTAMLQA